MSENIEKKFLDEEGLKVLWNQVNLKDYPNNSTLMAVLNAIDETKVDKEEINSLYELLDRYILNIDYDTLLAFDTNEIVIGMMTTSVLGQAILGQMVLA